MRLLSLLTLAVLSPLAFSKTIIHAGNLVDTASGEVLEAQSVIVEDDRITGVVSGYLEEDGATVIDMTGGYVMPGFMDMHVHLDGELDPPASYSEDFYMSSADKALRSTIYARRTLDAGFTTVRDLGTGDIESSFALRDAINKGIVPGPRIFAAGKSIATTGGHADPTNGVRHDMRGDPA